MVDKNIQIKHHNGSNWYNLFPKTKASLTDLSDGRTVQEVVSGLATDLSKKATKQEVEDEIERLIGGAPEALDTLVELAEALGNDDNFASSITAQIGQKVDKVTGKQLSANDFTDVLKSKLDSLKDHTSEISALSTGKVDKVTGKQLSANDFTDTLQSKLNSLKDHTSEISALSTGKADRATTYTKIEVDNRMSNLQANAIPVSESEPEGASVWFQEI